MKQTPTQKCLQPVRHYHLKNHLKTSKYSTVSSVQFWIQDKALYDGEDFTVHMKNPTSKKSSKSSNFSDTLYPTGLFKNSFAVSMHNNKLQELRSVFNSTTYYSMTYRPSGFWSNKSEIPIVIDRGASRSITPMTSDFIGQITPMDEPIQGLSATTRIKDIGTVWWNIRDSRGNSASVETTAYYIPAADIRLFSPQGFFSENLSGSFVMDSTGTILTLPNQLALHFDYHKGNNLPMAILFLLLILQQAWHLMPLQVKMWQTH